MSDLADLLPFEAQLRTPARRAKELVRRLLSLSAAPFGTLARVRTSEPAVALTFDDGPDPEWTPRVLETLERHGARGTFFMVGRRVVASPELVARVRAAGHATANHSWDHASLPRLERAARLAQLARCEAALHAQPMIPALAGSALLGSPLLGSASLAPPRLGTAATGRLFRPPFGEQTVASLRDARRAGYTVVGWDVVAEDWRDDAAEVLLDCVLRRLRRGSIVLFHDSLYVADAARFRDRAPMLAALDALLGRLGGVLRFVTLPELLGLGVPVWEHRYHYLPDDFHRRLV